MKKKGLLTLLGSICLVFLLAAPSLAQVIKLTLADQNAAVAWGPVHALQPWVKKVEDATKGRVKIEIFPAQTLAKGPDIWNAVKTGVADMGWCFHGYWAGHDPSLRCHYTSLAADKVGRKGKRSALEALRKISFHSK